MIQNVRAKWNESSHALIFHLPRNYSSYTFTDTKHIMCFSVPFWFWVQFDNCNAQREPYAKTVPIRSKRKEMKLCSQDETNTQRHHHGEPNSHILRKHIKCTS